MCVGLILGPLAAGLATVHVVEPVDRSNETLRGLVNDLDNKLAPIREQAYAAETVDDRRWRPSWLGLVVVTLLGIAIGFAVVQPWQQRCTYGRDVCQIAELDIDALRVTIPESELIAMLPNIDALDPNDELTAGDIFAMERFRDVDFGELLTQEEIDLLLNR